MQRQGQPTTGSGGRYLRAVTGQESIPVSLGIHRNGFHGSDGKAFLKSAPELGKNSDASEPKVHVDLILSLPFSLIEFIS